MAYTKWKPAWRDLPSKDTPVTADALNHIENGIVAAAATADNAVQPDDLATVATTGDYDDLTGTPTLGTAAAMSIEEVQSALVDGGLAEDPAFTGTFARLLFIDIADYCDDFTGVTDQTAGLRQAYEVAADAGWALSCSKQGTLLLDSVDDDLLFVPLTAGIPIIGPNKTLTLKIGENVPRWQHIFGTTDHAEVDLSGLEISGWVIDGNAANNPTDASNATNCHRNAFGAYMGDGIKIHDNTFVGWDGRNVITTDGRINGMSDVWIYNNRGTDIGGPYWHDHSAIYVNARDVHGFGNTFVGVIIDADTPSSAHCAWELHGNTIDWHDNIARNFQKGGILAGQGVNTPIGTFDYHSNKALNCARVCEVWAISEDVEHIHINRNYGEISIDQWPIAADGSINYPGTVSRNAFGGILGIYGVTDLQVEDNTVVWLPYTGDADENDCFFWWERTTSAATTEDVGVSIKRNKAYNIPSSAVIVRRFLGLTGWDVSDNDWYNIGSAELGTNYQAGMLVQDYTSNSGTNPIDGLKYDGNTHHDDQGSHTLSHPLILAAGSVRVHSGCTTTNGSNEVLDATVKGIDRGSLVTGTGIGVAPVYVTTVTPGVSFTMSKVATADGTVDLTLTGNVANTRNVEAAGTSFRLDDGATVDTFSVQSSQAVALMPFEPSSAEQVWLPADSFGPVTGSPAIGAVASRWRGMLMDASADERAATTIEIPTGWVSADVILYWTNAGAGSGDVKWGVILDRAGDGDTTAASGGGGSATPSAMTAPAQNVLEVTQFFTGQALDPSKLLNVRVERLGTDGGDTLANDAAFLGVMLRRAS